MRFDSKKVVKFAGEVSSCIVMGIVSAATQTLWYRIAEPKILDVMDKNDAKQKHPIGFRGVGVLIRAPLSFANFTKTIMERKNLRRIRNASLGQPSALEKGTEKLRNASQIQPSVLPL